MEFISKEKENIWKNSSIVFDSSSIFRLYEYVGNKSLLLKDIFDYKMEEIWITTHIKVELSQIYSTRLESKKRKFALTFEQAVNSKNLERFINRLSLQCEGNLFPVSFIDLLNEYKDGKQNAAAVLSSIKLLEAELEVHFKNIPLEKIFKLYFTKVYENPQIITGARSNTETMIYPPGHKDKSKKTNSDGDSIIWNEIIGLAKELESEITFVTADVKSDWFDSHVNGKTARPGLIENFSNAVDNKYKLNIISLTDFLQIASKFINTDIKELIKESVIMDLINEKFDNFYPDELIEMVEEYIEENTELHNEIENAADSCVDYIKFGQLNDYQIDSNSISYDENPGYYIVTIKIQMEMSLDASAYTSNEVFELGSPTVLFDAEVKCSIDYDWESEDTANKVLSEIYDLSIVDLTLIKVIPLYEEIEELDEYETDEYVPENYEPDEYEDEPDEYESEEFEDEHYDSDDDDRNS